MTWEEITLSVSAILAIVGLFRNLEQRKDEAFANLSAQLGSDQPVMRAFAASQLPSFYFFRHFLRFRRPYQDQVVHLALSALKNRNEEKHVRQALADALAIITRDERLSEIMARLRPHLYKTEGDNPRLPSESGRPDIDKRPREPDVIGIQVAGIIMQKFDFDNLDLTEAYLSPDCNLKNASFRGARLFNTCLDRSNLTGADLENSMLWNTSFRGANLTDSTINTTQVDSDTSFEGATMDEARVSKEVEELLSSDQRGVLRKPPSGTTTE